MGLYSTRSINKNKVQVYDTVLALPKEYKVVFVANLNEGCFPKIHYQRPLLKDHERDYFINEGFNLETTRMREVGERYFFYMAISRASESPWDYS